MPNETDIGVPRRMAELALDGAALLGAALITYGDYLIYRPAGFITAGGFLLGTAWLAARRTPS